MSTAFVVMTALPPTKGHIKLIEFAQEVGDKVRVILCTQPDEPFLQERYDALFDRFADNPLVWVRWFHRTITQDPETPGFRELWKGIMEEYGCTAGRDIIVASEPYGQWLAEITGTTFVPYDPYRELTPVKASEVRYNPWNNFGLIAEEFQNNLRIDVTIFGAESTGKTTLAKDLAREYNGHFFMEWARPYLEMCGSDITVDSMTAIWKGQRALEIHSTNFYDKPVAFFDTDLYSTIGYWQFPHWADTLGPVPQGLIEDAEPAELYIICPSNIPFETDPLRYGGDRREASDEYWIAVAEQYDLNYVVLEESNHLKRLHEAKMAVLPLRIRMQDRLTYDRGGF